jgi:hypothetical protein
MNIPANMVGIVENLMEIGKMGVDWDVVVAGNIIGKMGSVPTPQSVPTPRSVGATDSEIQQMLDRSKNAYNLFCAKNFRDAEKENPDPANRKETYRILGHRWTALKNDPLRYDKFRSYHVPYLKEHPISMSGSIWAGIVLDKPELRRSDGRVNKGAQTMKQAIVLDNEVDAQKTHNRTLPGVLRIDEFNELLDDVTEGESQFDYDSSEDDSSEDDSSKDDSSKDDYVKTWTCLVCTKKNIPGVYNCVCCGRIVGTVPDHPGLYWKSADQVWDVPSGESKAKRGYNNYAHHYRAHYKGNGFSNRNITRKISAGWKTKTREEKEQWADWEWAKAEMGKL